MLLAPAMFQKRVVEFLTLPHVPRKNAENTPRRIDTQPRYSIIISWVQHKQYENVVGAPIIVQQVCFCGSTEIATRQRCNITMFQCLSLLFVLCPWFDFFPRGHMQQSAVLGRVLYRFFDRIFNATRSSIGSSASISIANITRTPCDVHHL